MILNSASHNNSTTNFQYNDLETITKSILQLTTEEREEVKQRLLAKKNQKHQQFNLLDESDELLNKSDMSNITVNPENNKIEQTVEILENLSISEMKEIGEKLDQQTKTYNEIHKEALSIFKKN